MYRYIIVFLFLVSCSKGTLKEGDQFFEIQASWFYHADGVSKYVLAIDNVTIADTFAYSDPDVKTGIRKLVSGPSSGKKRIVLKQVEKDSIVLDTMLQVDGRKFLRFMQLDISDSPQILSEDDGEETEPDPVSPDRTKFRLYYADAQLPDSIKLVFYTCNFSKRPFAYDPDPVDSIVAYRRKFTPFKEMAAAPYARNSAFLFKLYDPFDGSLIQDIVFRNPTNISFSLGFFESLTTLRTTTGNPANKLNTSVFTYGYPGSTLPRLDKFHDKRLFTTAW